MKVQTNVKAGKGITTSQFKKQYLKQKERELKGKPYLP
jgi:hypothetical protein